MSVSNASTDVVFLFVLLVSSLEQFQEEFEDISKEEQVCQALQLVQPTK